METFTQDELKQIAELIGRAQIAGREALPVAILQQKIAKWLNPENIKTPETSKDGKSN